MAGGGPNPATGGRHSSGGCGIAVTLIRPLENKITMGPYLGTRRPARTEDPKRNHLNEKGPTGGLSLLGEKGSLVTRVTSGDGADY